MYTTRRNDTLPTPTFHDSSNSTYSGHFDGKPIMTKVTEKAPDMDRWVEEALSLHAGKLTVVGLDIEWRPHPIRHLSNKFATLQLCIDHNCLIVHLFYINYIPESIKDFCRDLKFTFVSVEVADDVERLRKEYGLECTRHVDIRELAKACWPGRFRRPGRKDLAKEVGGLTMMKPRHVTLSNREARDLSINQVEYACIDAYAYKIGSILIS